MALCELCKVEGIFPVKFHGKNKPDQEICLCKLHSIIFFQRGETWLLSNLPSNIQIKTTIKIKNTLVDTSPRR